MVATQYRPIEGFPSYRVGDDGSIWSCRHGRHIVPWVQMKPWIHKKRGPGRTYLCTDLVRDGVRHSFLVHRLILEAFVGPRPEGMECRHLDGNPRNNRLDNLVWGAPHENRDDAHRLNRYATTLTETQVREIRTKYAAGSVLQHELAKEYSTTRTNVNSILNRYSWRHIN